MNGVRVPFLDLHSEMSELRAELDAAFQRVMASGRFVCGPELEAFEAEFSSFTECRYAVGVGSGLAALELALRGFGVGPGDEVVVPAHTFIATWLAVVAVGATPVPVEPDPSTGNLDPRELEAAFTQRTRAVIPVHLYGRMADMSRIVTIAHRHGAWVLEDAAQAHGAKHRGIPAGAWGDAAAFSFYPSKNLGAFGDAGAITTSDAQLAAHLRALRSYGARHKYQHEELGTNSRLDELQAAFLRVKLRNLGASNSRRARIAQAYADGFAGLPGLELPAPDAEGTSVHHLYVVRHLLRDQLAAGLGEDGVETLIHYPVPPHRARAFSGRFDHHSLPLADRLASRVLSLPMGPHLSAEDVDYVLTSVRARVLGLAGESARDRAA